MHFRMPGVRMIIINYVFYSTKHGCKWSAWCGSVFQRPPHIVRRPRMPHVAA